MKEELLILLKFNGKLHMAISYAVLPGKNEDQVRISNIMKQLKHVYTVTDAVKAVTDYVLSHSGDLYGISLKSRQKELEELKKRYGVRAFGCCDHIHEGGFLIYTYETIAEAMLNCDQLLELDMVLNLEGECTDFEDDTDFEEYTDFEDDEYENDEVPYLMSLIELEEILGWL